MEIRFSCLKCKRFSKLRDLDRWAQTPQFKCKCGDLNQLKFSEVWQTKDELEECPLCHSFDFYVQKNVSKKLFLILLIPGLVGILILMSISFTLGFMALLGLTLVDLILFKILSSIAVCYQCGSKFYNFLKLKKISPFDHHIAERYRVQK